MIVYIDESGDLGWSLDKPYQAGGSSRYLTLAFLFCTPENKKYPKRVVKELYTTIGVSPAIELKGAGLDNSECEGFVDRALAMLDSHPDIRIAGITVRKENVTERMRDDENLLYNYVIGGIILPDYTAANEVLDLIPDPRSIKIDHGKSLFDYVRLKLNYELGMEIVVREHHVASDKSLSLKFIDIVAHIIWSKYELGDHAPADRLIKRMDNRRLYFGG